MFKILKKTLKYIGIFLVSIIFIYVYDAFIKGNFYKLDNNVYRSAQLFNFNMPYYIEKYNIKTILNLRGAKPKKDWYQTELSISKKYNILHIDHKISSGGYLDFNQTSQIVHLLKTLPKPLLIHCEGGADRTSLASALYDYAILHKSKKEAQKELSWYYGHLPSIRSKVIAMDKSFDNYVKHTKQDNK